MAKCCNALAARLRHRVTLQERSRTPDGQGGFTEAWADVADLWAEIKPQKSYERFQAMQTQSPTTHKITVRYRSGVTTRHRLLYRGRVFDIKGVVNPEEGNATLELTVLEQQA